MNRRKLYIYISVVMVIIEYRPQGYGSLFIVDLQNK